MLPKIAEELPVFVEQPFPRRVEKSYPFSYSCAVVDNEYNVDYSWNKIDLVRFSNDIYFWPAVRRVLRRQEYLYPKRKI